MSKRMSILLVVLTIVSGLIGGAISNYVFITRSALATDSKLSKDVKIEPVKDKVKPMDPPNLVVAEDINQSKVLTVEGVRVVDKDGKLLMALGKAKENSYGLFIYNSSGDPEAYLGMLKSGCGVGILGKDGELVASMVAFKDSGIICVRKEGNTRAMMSVDDSGGIFSVNGKEGNNRAIMSEDEYGGYVGVFGKNDKVGAVISIDESGGSVRVHDKAGTPGASIDVRENGGAVVVSGKAGESMMGVNKSGGTVSVRDKDGKGGAIMGANEYGGNVIIGCKGNGEIRASMQVNEYGNGAIGLWDKDGNEIK